jgi:ankyrin repeat protein
LPIQENVKAKKPMTFERLWSRSFGKESYSFWSFNLGSRGLQVDDLQQYLDAGGDPNRRVENDQTLLHVAADSGEPELVKLLISRGAAINAKGYHGYTPLHLAVDADCDTSAREDRRLRDLPTTRLLIESGADEFIRDEDGKIARDTAVAYGRVPTELYDAIPRKRSSKNRGG